MKSNQFIKFLPWDSQFFGFNIGLVKSIDLDVDHWPAMMAEYGEKQFACLYLLAEPGDTTIIQLAEDNDFHFMDVRLTLTHMPATQPSKENLKNPSDYRLRNATLTDLPALKSIARISHQNTRFYADPNFSRTDCDRLYEVWIENSLKGYAQQVFVAENKTIFQPEAYITCHLKNKHGEISLIAVHPSARGNGIGSSLVQQALFWFIENGATQIDVVTQGASRPAVRLYQKAGFQLSYLQLWFHKWTIA